MALWGQRARYSSPATPAPLEDETGPPVRRQRQKQTRLSKEQVDQLVKAYGDGDSVAGLARRFEVNETTVRAHLTRREVATRGRAGYRLLHGELLDRASQLYAAGKSLRSIGSELGVFLEGGEVGAPGCRVGLGRCQLILPWGSLPGTTAKAGTRRKAS